MVTLSDWRNLLRARRRRGAEIDLRAYIRSAGRGIFGTILGVASDGNNYYIKPIYNKTHCLVPITDQIVGRAGALIAAPVCEVRTINVSDDFAGQVVGEGQVLRKGIAHASLEVSSALDVDLTSTYLRERDDNTWRHAAYFALHDWCWGNDVQGLIDLSNDRQFFCHDLGNFFPPDGPTWSADELLARVDEPHEYRQSITGIPIEVADDVADLLEEVTRQQLVEVLSQVPRTWPVRNRDLEVVGYFLERRATASALRLRRRFRGNGTN